MKLKQDLQLQFKAVVSNTRPGEQNQPTNKMNLGVLGVKNYTQLKYFQM